MATPCRLPWIKTTPIYPHPRQSQITTYLWTQEIASSCRDPLQFTTDIIRAISMSMAGNIVMLPSSEDEWTIHVINIHGVFFERWCQKFIADTKDWKIKSTNYPVEFPPPNGQLRGKESALDIRAEQLHEKTLWTLLIECKKNNPDFINWVFFLKHSSGEESPVYVSTIQNIPSQTPSLRWNTETGLEQLDFFAPIADEARETRGSYIGYKKGDKTKTANAAISEAAYQVALARQAIVFEEGEFSRIFGSPSGTTEMPWNQQVFLPIIVTTARIFTCDFNPSDVNSTSGEIPYTKAILNEQPFVLFEYTLPRHLQHTPANLSGVLHDDRIEIFMRMHIFVVHSEKLGEFLNMIITNS